MNIVNKYAQHCKRRALRLLSKFSNFPAESSFSHPPFVRAAHYFSDGWPLNFWQIMDPGKLIEELSQIIGDGFNTIILVIPWRGFQSDQLKPEYSTVISKGTRKGKRRDYRNWCDKTLSQQASSCGHACSRARSPGARPGLSA